MNPIRKILVPTDFSPHARELLEQYECGPVAFSDTPGASSKRHLVLDHVVRPEQADARQRFEAAAWALCDMLSQRWLNLAAQVERFLEALRSTCAEETLLSDGAESILSQSAGELAPR
jgi:hypothetical protein